MYLGFTSLRVRLMVVFLAVLLIPLLATVLYGHVFARDLLSRQLIERSANQVHLQAESVVSSLRQAQGDAFYLAALRSLQMLHQQVEAVDVQLWRSEVAQDFMVLLSVRPMYRALRYLNVDGMEIVAVESDGHTVSNISTLQDRSTTDYFQRAISLPSGGVYVSSFVNNEGNSDEGVPLVYYAIHVPDNSGLVVLDLHAGWLLRTLPAELNADIWALVDQDGRFLVYPEHFDPATADATQMLTGGQGSFDNAQSVFVYDTIHPTGSAANQFWVIYHETPKSVLFTDLTNFYIAAGGFTLVGVSLAVLLAFLMSHRLVHPIARLKQMAVDFGRDGVPPVEPSRLSNDETGALTRTFCEMARELERKRTQEHHLLEMLIRAQEEERKLIAYDLHDGLIQQLVGARFYLTNCREVCPIGAQDAARGIQRGCDALTEAIVEGRRIIEGLRPAVLDDLGLVAALEEVSQMTAQAAKWELALDLHSLPHEPEKSVSVTLFRITQEALNNARKHAQAEHVRVHLHNSVGISLVVEDDGMGFDTAILTNDGRGLGVRTMQERAALLGGKCTITSTPKQGTKIEVWVPHTGVSPSSARANGKGKQKATT